MATPNISSMYLIATSKTPKVISLRYIRLANTRIRAAPGDILLNMNTLALLSSDNPPETWSSTSACECSGKKRTEYTPNVDFLPPKCIQYKPVKIFQFDFLIFCQIPGPEFHPIYQVQVGHHAPGRPDKSMLMQKKI